MDAKLQLYLCWLDCSVQFPDCICLGLFSTYTTGSLWSCWNYFSFSMFLNSVSEPSFMCCHQEWKMIQPLDIKLVFMRNTSIIKYSLHLLLFHSHHTNGLKDSARCFLSLFVPGLPTFSSVTYKKCIFTLWLLKLSGKHVASKMTTQDYLNNSSQRVWTPVFPAERWPRVSRTHVQRLLFKLQKPESNIGCMDLCSLYSQQGRWYLSDQLLLVGRIWHVVNLLVKLSERRFGIIQRDLPF